MRFLERIFAYDCRTRGEGLEDMRVRNQHALVGRMTFTMISILLIEMAKFRKKNPKTGCEQPELFEAAA